MSYSKKIEYEIVPEESFSVIRNCSGCGKKTSFKNTKKFRVNANGNKLDVWLIYQCEKCRHTWNLAIYERQKISALPAEEYQRFLQNDQELAQQYGRNIRLFQKNRAKADSEQLEYRFVKLSDTGPEDGCGHPVLLTIQNPCELKIRPEKQIAGALEISRSQVEKWKARGVVEVKDFSSKCLVVCLNEIYLMDAFNDKTIG